MPSHVLYRWVVGEPSSWSPDNYTGWYAEAYSGERLICKSHWRRFPFRCDSFDYDEEELLVATLSQSYPHSTIIKGA